MGKRLRIILALATAASIVFIAVAYKPMLEALRPPPESGTGEGLPVDEQLAAARLKADRAEQGARELAAELRAADLGEEGRPQLALLIATWLRARAAAEGESLADSTLAATADSLAVVWLAEP